MKNNITITKALILMVGFAFMLTSCSSWRYNKQQRVQIEAQNIPSVDTKSDPQEMVTTPTTLLEKEKEQTLANNATITYGEQKNLELTKVKEQKSGVVGSISDKKPTSPFKLLADQLKRHDKKVCKAQGVEKAAVSGWVRIMIILFVVGFILLLIGIFLSVFIFGGFWWLFWTFGALCILAGFIVLILGLLGLI